MGQVAPDFDHDRCRQRRGGDPATVDGPSDEDRGCRFEPFRKLYGGFPQDPCSAGHDPVCERQILEKVTGWIVVTRHRGVVESAASTSGVVRSNQASVPVGRTVAS